MDDDIKAYFDQRFSQVDQRLVDLEIKLTKRMDDFAVSLEESIRDSQTEILRSIEGYAESSRARMSAMEAQNPAILKRLDILETRIQEFESRYGLHPKNPPQQ
jgi:hypothetical protein